MLGFPFTSTRQIVLAVSILIAILFFGSTTEYLELQSQSRTVGLSSQFPVQSVQVYPHQAEVNRITTFSLQEGSNSFDVTGLPGSIVSDSIRVRLVDKKLDSSIKIQGIESELIYNEDFQQDDFKKAEAELKKAQENLRSLTDEYSALKEEETVLKNIQLGKVPDPESNKDLKIGIDTERWLKTLNFIQTSLESNHRKMDALLEKIDLARENLSLAMFIVDRLKSRSSTTKTKLLIKIESQTPQKIKMLITYLVPNASWYPIYTAKVIPDGRKGKVEFESFALVENNTGEDWTNAKLQFSAANPEMSADLPELRSWIIASKTEQDQQAFPVEEDESISMKISSSGSESYPASKSYPKKRRPLPAPSSGIQRKMAIQVQESQDLYSSNQAIVKDERAKRKSQQVEKEIQSIKSNIMKRDESIRLKNYSSALDFSEETINSIKRVDPKYRQFLQEEVDRSLQIKKQALNHIENKSILSKLVSPAKSSGGFNYRYTPNTKETILSDGSFHKVYLGKKIWNADLSYEINAVDDNLAYLIGSVIYPDDIPLLSGPVSVFHDRDFVGESFLKNISRKENFKLNLGASEEVSIERKTEEFREKTGLISSNYSFKNKISTHVKNLRNQTIRISLYDRIPYSSDSRIQIQNIKTNKNPTEKSEKFGLYRFDIEIPSGKKEEIHIEYEMSHPQSIITNTGVIGSPAW